jgi:transcriptional regulator GlxA family with amidase domain
LVGVPVPVCRQIRGRVRMPKRPLTCAVAVGMTDLNLRPLDPRHGPRVMAHIARWRAMLEVAGQGLAHR